MRAVPSRDWPLPRQGAGPIFRNKGSGACLRGTRGRGDEIGSWGRVLLRQGRLALARRAGQELVRFQTKPGRSQPAP